MMHTDDASIAKILVQQSYLTKADVTAAKKGAKKNDMRLFDYLLSEGTMTRHLIGQAIAEHLKVRYFQLLSSPPTHELVSKVPEKVARKYLAVCVSEGKKEVHVASADPTDLKMQKALQKSFKNKKVVWMFALEDDIREIFKRYQLPLNARFKKLLKKSASAPELLNEVFEDAVRQKTSDIHFEPFEDDVALRFRIDGVLHQAGRMPHMLYETVVNRIKVMSHMRIDEHYAAQDGSIRFKLKDQSIDMRVSVLPSLYGEKIVIRLLAKYVESFHVGDLGLGARDQESLEKAYRSPFGMVLVTGPTGSGKSTTLYSILKILNRSDVNIMTIEDPVEYRMKGVNHIQVNTQTDLTFSKGLRAIVRQDPDIILVGEIRDQETAEIAINAALTGHLLLSTFHANDAATAIPRLLDMGVEPFLLSSTLEAVLAQRLVRRICQDCRLSHTVDRSYLEQYVTKPSRFFAEKKVTLYKGKGCEKCSYSGYLGRVAIFELIRMTSEVRDLILENPSSQEIWSLAKTQGAQSLFEDGLQKVQQGLTTIKEVLRVAPVS